MNVKRVWAVFFSATGTTQKVVTRIAEVVADGLGVERKTYDFTLSTPRESTPTFSANDLVVLGTPVYAGRVPNVLVKYLVSLRGNGALAVPVVLFGNRNYDDALIELRDILKGDGFHTVAAAAFVGEHSFSYVLGAGRPDNVDMAVADNFARRVIERLGATSDTNGLAPIGVKGGPSPYRPHYRPLDRQGNPVDFRSIRPLTSDACNDCKICAESCPMASISFDNVREYTGICIRCGACAKKCPQQARYYDNEAYLLHRQELEEGFTSRAEPELFV